MKMLLLASLLLVPAQSRAAEIRPDTAAGQRLVHSLASKVSDAFVAQAEHGDTEDSSCDSLKDELLESLSQLDVKRSENLFLAKTTLEKGACQKNLFAVTVYLRAADSLN